MNKTWEAIFIATIFGMIGFIIVLCADRIFAEDVKIGVGVVESKSYTPSTNSLAVGTSTDGSGGMVVSNHHTPERWMVVLRYDGDVLPIQISKTQWKKINNGSVVNVMQAQGRLFNFRISIETIPDSQK